MLTWIKNNFMPVAHNVAATVATTVFLGGSLFLGDIVLQPFGGCPKALTPLVTRGELALLKDKVVEAKAIAMDAVSEAPTCSCSNRLMAHVLATELQHLPADASADQREALREECHRFALNAQSLLGDGQAKAVLEYSSAYGSE